MKILAKPRGRGKTYDLIQRSLETGYPILVANTSQKEYIQNMNNTVKVFTLYDSKRNISIYDKVIVDEIEMVLTQILNKGVDMVSYTGDIDVIAVDVANNPIINENDLNIEYITETTSTTINRDTIIDSSVDQILKIKMKK